MDWGIPNGYSRTRVRRIARLDSLNFNTHPPNCTTIADVVKVELDMSATNPLNVQRVDRRASSISFWEQPRSRYCFYNNVLNEFYLSYKPRCDIDKIHLPEANVLSKMNKNVSINIRKKLLVDSAFIFILF